MKRWMLMCTAAALAASLWAASPAATPDGKRWNEQWWRERVEAKEKQAQTPHDTVFVGDSITHFWEREGKGLQERYFGDVLNLGFGSDKTQHVLWRLQRIDWAKTRPKRFMVMIGTNNAGIPPASKPEETIEGIQAIVAYLRKACPEAKITLLKIFPRGALDDPRRLLNNQVNAKLDTLAEPGHVYVLDLAPYLTNPDGTPCAPLFTNDSLHLSALGYRVWAAAVAPSFLRDYR